VHEELMVDVFAHVPRRFLWDQEKELWDIFHELDRDGDGKLDEAELANALKRNGGVYSSRFRRVAIQLTILNVTRHRADTVDVARLCIAHVVWFAGDDRDDRDDGWIEAQGQDICHILRV
jgi:hypothetical protein